MIAKSENSIYESNPIKIRKKRTFPKMAISIDMMRNKLNKHTFNDSNRSNNNKKMQCDIKKKQDKQYFEIIKSEDHKSIYNMKIKKLNKHLFGHNQSKNYTSLVNDVITYSKKKDTNDYIYMSSIKSKQPEFKCEKNTYDVTQCSEEFDSAIHSESVELHKQRVFKKIIKWFSHLKNKKINPNLLSDICKELGLLVTCNIEKESSIQTGNIQRFDIHINGCTYKSKLWYPDTFISRIPVCTLILSGL